MNLSRRLAAAALVLAMGGTALRASTLVIIPQVTAAFDLSGNPVPVPQFNTPIGVPLRYQVDFTVSVGGLQAGQYFGAVGFNIDLTSGLQSISGWKANKTGLAGTAPFPVPIWQINADEGDSSKDLQGILALAVAPPYNGITDPREGFAQQVPGELGSVIVQWNGVSAETLSLSFMEASGIVPGAVNYSLYNEDGSFILPSLYTIDNYQVQFGFGDGDSGAGGSPAPEPASLSMVAVGCVSLLARRRKCCE